MIKVNQIKIALEDDRKEIEIRLSKILKLPKDKIKNIEILRESIDARKKPKIFLTYTLTCEIAVDNEELYVKRLKNRDVSVYKKLAYEVPYLNDKISNLEKSKYFSSKENRPLIVGFGPCGIFAGLVLARAGARPIIYERGECVDERIKSVEKFWNEGVLNEESNPQFGEGGAGTFSDGKLNTMVKDKFGRNRFVLETFVSHGADPKILYKQKPHIGTDKLIDIVKSIREEIISLGGEIHFNKKYEYNGEKNLILAIGHSSRDTYEELKKAGFDMEAKDFAMGLRVQHRQDMIDRVMYGKQSRENLKKLGASPYKLTYHSKSGRGVYSFCMCPGGYVLASSSEKEKLCINGMSYNKRDSENANSAIIMTVKKDDYNGERDVLGGIKLQREMEKRAYNLLSGKIPVEKYGDFKLGNKSKAFGKVKPCIKGEYGFADLRKLFDFKSDSAYSSLNDFNTSFIEAMEYFGRKIKGFNDKDTILAGIEARTSAPVRIIRDENFKSNIKGVYPAGEGAGYAGGIMSAAMDGMKVAEALVKEYNSL